MATQDIALFHTKQRKAEEILIGYGYTKEMISVLKKFSASCDRSSLSDEEIRSIAGTCSGVITSDYFHGRYARVIYNWSWDHCPIMTLSDSAAMRWLAFTDGGSSVDVGWNIIEKNIDYYCNGTFMFQKHGTLEPNLEFYGLNLQFAMNEPFIMPDATISYAYAKEGEIEIEVYLEIEVVPSVSISYLRVAALYGHSTLGPGEPSIGLSPEGGISIGFSGNWAIDPIAGHKVKISVNPDYDYYHPIITPIN